MKREEIVGEARTWLGTKWQHQACVKGVACDCVGLVRGIYTKFVGPLTVQVDYTRLWPLHKSEEKMYKEFSKYFIELPLAKAKAGDILLFGFGNGPAHHCAIVSDGGFIIHTWTDVGKVVESRLDARWQLNCRYAFAFPGVED